jgi:hypothetical protein
MLVGVRDFSLLQNIQTEAYPAFYWMDSGARSQRVKQRGCELNHSPPTSARFRMNVTVHLLPLYAFMTLTGKIYPFTDGVKSDKN